MVKVDGSLNLPSPNPDWPDVALESLEVMLKSVFETSVMSLFSVLE